MAQAKTLNQAEIDQVLRYIASKQRYAIRNKAMLLTSLYSGMRVGEIAVCEYAMYKTTTVRLEERFV